MVHLWEVKAPSLYLKILLLRLDICDHVFSDWSKSCNLIVNLSADPLNKLVQSHFYGVSPERVVSGARRFSNYEFLWREFHL